MDPHHCGRERARRIENRAGWPTPGEIVDEFWHRSGHPSQAQLNALINDMAIPVKALISGQDGADFPIAMFRVTRSRSTFEFTENEIVRPVLGFVAWGEDGAAVDLVAWSPRDNWLGTWLGRAGLLNEHELQEPRIGGHLRVYLNISDWLRAHREGVVVIDKTKAARLLEDTTLQAFDFEEGVALQKIIERPRARIVVPAPRQDRTAA